MLEEVVEHNNRCMDQHFLVDIKRHIKEQVRCCCHMAIDIIVISMVD